MRSQHNRRLSVARPLGPRGNPRTAAPRLSGAACTEEMAQLRRSTHLVIPAAVIAAMILLITLAITEASAQQIAGNVDARWTEYIRVLDEALAKRNIGVAELALHRAYLAALGSRGWEGMVEVGDAALRIAAAVGARNVYEPKARQAYLLGFFRARQQGSVDGLLHTAEAFAALGDRDVAAQCIRTAEQVAERTRDAQARDGVRSFGERLSARFLEAERH